MEINIFKVSRVSKVSRAFILFGSVVGVLLIFGFLFSVSKADAAVGINKQINFQGKLVDNNGLVVADNTYSVVFSLYSVSSGGTNVWTETDSVTTKNGIFQVALGANTAFPGNVDFNSDSLYLGIKVGTDAEMTPRIRFTAVPYAFNAAALDGVVATQSATGFNLQGGTSSFSNVSFTTTAGALTLQPGVTEGLTIQSNGANGLTLDTGGSGTVSIGTNNAAAVSLGKGSNNTAFTFNNGTGGFSVNGSGIITFSALSAALGLVYTSGTNGVLSQTAPTGGTQCLQSDASNNGLTWVTCNSGGTYYWQTNGTVLSPGNSTMDVTFGGTATTSAKFAFIDNAGGIPTASISAGTANNNTYLTGSGILATTNRQTLTLGSSSTGNILIDTPTGLSLDTTNNAAITTGTGLTTLGGSLTVDGATLSLANAGSSTIQTTGSNTGLTLLSNGTGNITLGQNAGTGNILIQPNAGGQAALIVKDQGVGDLFTASAGANTKFVIGNNGTFQTNGALATVGYNRIGTGTTANGLSSANDLYITGKLEVAGNVYSPATGIAGYFQRNAQAVSPTNSTDDFLLGGIATTSAKFAFTGLDSTSPVASIAANPASGTTTGLVLNSSGTIQGLNMNSLTLGGATTGNLQFYNASNFITSGGNLTLAGAAGITLAGNSADINFTGTGTDTITTAAGQSFALMPGGSGQVGINTNVPGASLDVHGNSGTSAVVSASGTTSFAGFVVNNSGVGDLLTASKSGTTKFVINNQGNVGIGTAIPFAALDVRASSATTPIASVAGATNFAALVVNNSGSGDIMTASSGGITRFRMTNNGSTVFQGDTLTSIGSLGNNSAVVSETNQSAVVNAIGDEGSLVPNSGFESAVTANKTTNVASGPVSDGWIATATMSAAVTRIASDSAKGNDSVMFKLNASQSTSISSVCLPLNLRISGNYNLNFWANTVTSASPVVRGFVDGFTTEANCQSNTSPTPFMQGNPTASTTNTWKVYGGATPITTSSTNKWGRVRISVNCPASCANANLIEIDGIRLIETSNAVGVDYAEDYPADPNDVPQPGEVVSLVASGGASLVAKTHIAMDQAMVGVISTNPGDVLDDGSMTGAKVTVALAGRVPVNVSTANGPIQVGDYLTSSSLPGVAVKATGSGPVIGTAMEDDTDTNTADVNQITMFIKNTYYNGGTSSDAGLSLLSGAQDASVLLSMLGDATATSSALSGLTTGDVADGLSLIISHMAQVYGASSSANIPITASASASPFGNDLSTIQSATVSGDLRVKGDGLFEGILHIVDTLFANNFIVNGVSDFFGNVFFHSSVTFDKTPTFTSDTAGIAIVKKGTNHVDVKFTKSYDQQPVINTSITMTSLTPTPGETITQQQQRQNEMEQMLLTDNIRFIITNKTVNGFTILLDKPADEDIAFSWLALAVQNPIIFQSTGASQQPTPTIGLSPSPIDSIMPTNAATTSAGF